MRAFMLLFLPACLVGAQSASNQPEFEVASVTVTPPSVALSPHGVVRGCGQIDPALVRCNGVSLRMLVMRAYGVRGYQVEGPGLNSETYDVMAKVPAAVPPDKIPAMLQALLAERFALKVHKETRVFAAYKLNAAKSGAELKRVDATKLPPAPEPGSVRQTPIGGQPLSSMPAGVDVEIVRMNGSREIRGNMTIEQFTRILSASVDRPVIDNTGLKGTYEIDLPYVDENEGASGSEPEVRAPTKGIFQALQQRLGLKLDAGKVAIEVIIVDGARKVPTAN